MIAAPAAPIRMNPVCRYHGGTTVNSKEPDAGSHIAVAIHAAEVQVVASRRQAVVSRRGFRGERRPTAGIHRIGIQQPVRWGELPPVGSGQ